MEQVRNQKLDHLCEAIGDARDTLNQAKTDEQSHIAAALQVLQAEQTMVYTHAGVQLVRVPGADRLRVRLVPAQGDLEVTTPASASVEEAGGDG